MDRLPWTQKDFPDGTKLRRLEVPAHTDLTALSGDVWDNFWRFVVPLQAEAKWDYVRVEAWPDSGRILLFPALTRARRRVDVMVLELTFEEILQRWAALEEQAVSDRVFEREIRAVVRKVFAALKATYSNDQGWAATVGKAPEVRCYRYEVLDQKF